ncbi:uncharacterized protein COLE_05170 [Cutaneotrichosporon oleaginosum]|nr:hypothetical protein COLE_05170 [Cutaneotrichosporon oleaginosum]
MDDKFKEQPGPHTGDYKFYTTTVPVTVPLPNPTTPLAPAPKPVLRTKWYGLEKPHALLWLSLALSTLAIILGVPKGSLPTVTGRHRELRAQELLVQERLTLINQLSGLLPPPLAALFAVPDTSPTALDTLRLSRGLQLWHSRGHTWWNVEDLGAGAQVVRTAQSSPSSASPLPDREVWVLRSGDGDAPLLAALTNSLLARERLFAELEAVRAQPCPAATLSVGAGEKRKDKDEDEWRAERQRLRQRSDELEEREQDVIQREMWVVDAMR